MVTRNGKGAGTVLLLSAAVFAGCGGGEGSGMNGGESEAAEKQRPEPVELTVYYAGGAFGKDRFMEIYGNQIVQKYPYMSFKYLQSGTGGGSEGTALANAVATKTPIDILFTSTTRVPSQLIDFGLEYDISELITKHKFDLNALQPQTIDAVKAVGGGKLYGLPVAIPTSKLIYNRDLFDKFGVPYPKDGMTWDETFALAQRMTRNEGGVQYWGLTANITNLVQFNQLSAGFVDPTTNKSLLLDNKWQKFVSNIARFYSIPGIDPTVPWATQYKMFGEEGKVAMLVGNHSVSDTWPLINWDLAKFPSFPDMPGVGGAPLGNFFGVTRISEHKDAAFQAIAYLTSAEYQIWASRKGFMEGPSNKDSRIIAEFGKEIPYWQGRNAKALIPDKYAAPYALTSYDTVGTNPLTAQINKLIIGETPDVNTALRMAADEADKAIQTQISKTK